MKKTIHYTKEAPQSFAKTLKKRVNQYFSENALSKHRNPAMVGKTIVMLGLYIIPYILIMTHLFPPLIMFAMVIIMGFGIAGIGMNVMHDANHFAYSKNPKTNRIMGYSMYLLGADAYNWKIKHNKLHHNFTNIYNKDEDIESRVVLRFAYSSPLRFIHRFQYLFAILPYSLMTLSMITGDISKRIKYRKDGQTHLSRKRYVRSLIWLIIAKLVYFFFIIALPILVLDIPWWQIVIGFLAMHLIAGFILSTVFQLAHVIEGPIQVEPDQEGNVSHSLAVHQLKTTADFSKHNRFISWYTGGLNFQIEHHLFPRICHVHYKAISDIVKKTAHEFNVPYHYFPSVWKAFAAHLQTLKKLGKMQTIPVAK